MRFPKSPETGMQLFRTVAALVFLVAAASPAARAQSLRTLRAEFTRTIRSELTTETIMGTLYFQAPDRLILVVQDPVHQWVIFEEEGVLFWYPDEAKAWRLIEKHEPPPNLSSLFVAIPRADCGLAGAGFKIKDSETRGDVLLTRWKPPYSLRSTIDTVKVQTRGDLPCVLEVQDRRENVLARLTYSYASIGELTLPEHVVLEQRLKKVVFSEEIVYSGHEIDVELPPGIADFQLPSDVAVEEVKL
jgi:outer membrane lipoprotein-sorting protein